MLRYAKGWQFRGEGKVFVWEGDKCHAGFGARLKTKNPPECCFQHSGGFLLSGKRDSNPRPLVWETNALPTELFPHVK